MKILIDTNVLLDVALKREAFFDNSARVIDWAEAHPGLAAIAWHSVSTLAYLMKGQARGFIADLLTFVEVAAGDTLAVRQALVMPTPDVEDALQVSAALVFGAKIVVTRNMKDFKRIPIKILTPAEFVRAYGLE